MKRALFWIAFAPLALSLVVISIVGIALCLVEATFRALLMVYDELLHRFESWCFNSDREFYGRDPTPLLDVFMIEFRDNALWKQL